MFTEQLFVGGDDAFARQKALGKEGFRRLDPAEELGYDLNFVVVDDFVDVASDDTEVNAERFGFFDVFFDDVTDLDIHAVVFQDLVVIFL